VRVTIPLSTLLFVRQADSQSQARAIRSARPAAMRCKADPVRLTVYTPSHAIARPYPHPRVSRDCAYRRACRPGCRRTSSLRLEL